MMMARIIIISIMLLSFVGCKSTYKANTKSELARLCLNEFPLDNVPIETKIDTVTISVKEFIEVDCDTIGKVDIPHVCKKKIVKETVYVNDPRQAYLIQNLEGKLELKRERISQLISLHSEALDNKSKQHKEEIKSLKTKYKNETDTLRKDRNKWRWIVILIGSILGIGIIRKLKII